MSTTWDHLADFLAWLQDQGDLVRISAEVDPVFELTEVTERLCRADDGGPAIVFESVRGSNMPIVTNLLGAERRLRRVLRAESFDAAGQRLIGRLSPEPPRSWWDMTRWLPHWSEILRTQPVTVRSAACQHVVHIGRDCNLTRLPIPHFWPQESGRSITSGQVCFLHPETHQRQLCTTSLEVLSEDRLRVFWPRSHCGNRSAIEYRHRHEQMPVAVVLGGDPLLNYLSAAPLPNGIDPYVCAGYLRGRSLELVKCRTHSLEVPAGAEIILEGFLEAGETPSSDDMHSGFLVNETGSVNPPMSFPTLHISAVTQRSNPFFPVTVHGGMGHEDYWIGKANERIVLPFASLFLPEILDWHFPRTGHFRQFLFVKIRNDFPDQAHKVMQGIWSLFPTVHAKFIVVVDELVDIHDEGMVWETVGSMVNPRRDTMIVDGPLDEWDHAVSVLGVGQKMGIDATRRWKSAGQTVPIPPRTEMNAQIVQQVTERWTEFWGNR
ncbi:MAG: UbiD family decarboxylase [Planctomycetota bacterium]|nr:UbiD family decarboxylase [Planctomycetota bacterium]MDA1214211.1 UbiD family decarboxylase [Planctomycetota bacterium]